MFQTKKDTKPLNLHVKEWYIIVKNQQEGPYSLLDLRKDPRFTPDTLVWKKGFQEWVQARFVPEIREIFKDEPEAKPIHDFDKEKKLERELGLENQITLTLQQDPYQFLLWLLLILLILFYTFYLFYR